MGTPVKIEPTRRRGAVMIATNPKFTPNQIKITADAQLRAENLFLNGFCCAIPTTKLRYRKTEWNSQYSSDR